VDWLVEDEAKRLLETAEPSSNITPEERKRLVGETTGWLRELIPQFDLIAHERAQRLLAAHRRVRRITREGGLTVKPQLPVDVLGTYVYMPVPKGVR
jgi:hypothetical protein